jgi:GT2 family glycosyltransferase
MDPMISVIIPNRDGAEVIGACLDALARQQVPPAEIIVVDDASRDISPALVRRRSPEARLLELPRSRGYAGACVAGLGAARGQWIAVLNNDTVPEPGWIGALLAAASDDRIGAVASRVLADGPGGTIDSTGLRIERNGMAFLRGHGESDRAAGPEIEKVFGAAGSAALYRRAMLEDIGFFEPDYFAYYEDVDLAYRARWAGYSCVLASAARVRHRHSYTTTRLQIPKRRLLQRNRLRTLIRNWPAAWLCQHFPRLAAYDLASVAVAAREGVAGQALRARLDLARHLALDLAARRRTLAAARVTASEMSLWLDRK